MTNIMHENFNDNGFNVKPGYVQFELEGKIAYTNNQVIIDGVLGAYTQDENNNWKLNYVDIKEDESAMNAYDKVNSYTAYVNILYEQGFRENDPETFKLYLEEDYKNMTLEDYDKMSLIFITSTRENLLSLSSDEVVQAAENEAAEKIEILENRLSQKIEMPQEILDSINLEIKTEEAIDRLIEDFELNPAPFGEIDNEKSAFFHNDIEDFDELEM